MARNRLGEILLGDNLITRQQLEHALQQTGGARLGETLIALDYIGPEKLAQAIAKQFQLPFLALRDATFDPEAVRVLNGRTARRYKVVPISNKDKKLRIGLSDPLNVQAVDDISLITGLNLEISVMSTVDIDRALSRLYPDSVAANDTADLSAVESTPVVRLVNRLITQAVDERASDIHLEPQDHGVRVRFRIDGMLHDITRLEKDIALSIVSRIKIMAGLDISERRMPQDGGIRHSVNNEQLDLRVSTLPTVLGEKVVMRLLNSGSSRLSLQQIGLLPDSQKQVEEMLKASYGMLLVTGPTGSGKTTTLYSALSVLHTPDRNIVTVEDPVEFHIQVNSRIGLNFAHVLRAFVRQDPDIMMVGEIRDLETADIAVRSALTGHLVLSSLHTNDAPSTITRLADMGIEPFLIASSVVGIVAQRLVRRLCPHCRKPLAIQVCSPEAIALGLEPSDDHNFYQAVGCDKCGGDGYRGRVGVFEILKVDEEMRNLITARANTSQIRAAARAKGTRSFREDGVLKAREGTTTISEVLRVAYLLEA